MNATNNQKVMEVAEKIHHVGVGNTYPHAVIAEMLGVDKGTRAYYGLVVKLKRLLRRNYGVFCDTINKVGYRIVTPGDEIKVCEGEYVQSVRRMARAVLSTNLIRLEKIEDQNKKAQTLDGIQRMANIYGMIRASQPLITKARPE